MPRQRPISASFAIVVLSGMLSCGWAEAATLRGRIVDVGTGKTVAARLYIRGAEPNGKWFFAKSSAANGSAVGSSRPLESPERCHRLRWLRRHRRWNLRVRRTPASAAPFVEMTIAHL